MAVVAIVIMAVAVPIIAGTGSSEAGYNETGFRAARYDTTETDLTMTLTLASSGLTADLTVGGATVYTGLAVTSLTDILLTIMTDSTLIYTYRTTSGTVAYCPFFFVADGQEAGQQQQYTATLTLSVKSGILTIGDSDTTTSCNWIILPTPDGDLVGGRVFYSATSIDGRMDQDDTAYWAYWRGAGNIYYIPPAAIAYGSPGNLEEITVKEVQTDKTFSTPTASAVDITEKDGKAVKIGNLTIPDSTGSDLSLGAVFIPYEYSIQTGDPTIRTLVDLIPLLMIVGLMVAVVAAYVQSREM